MSTLGPSTAERLAREVPSTKRANASCFIGLCVESILPSGSNLKPAFVMPDAAGVGGSKKGLGESPFQRIISGSEIIGNGGRGGSPGRGLEGCGGDRSCIRGF